MGDIEYLCKKEFDGKITRLTGDLSSLADTLTHTAATGKDAYVLVAKIIPSGFAQSTSRSSGAQGVQVSNNSTEAKIELNAVEKDRVTVGMSSGAASLAPSNDQGGSGSGYGALTDGVFHAVVGSKVTTGQTIEIENTLDNGNCIAQLVILEENTGTDPTILASSITVDATISGDVGGDLQFIQEKVDAGDYFQVTGPIAEVGDTISYTVPTGRTAFLLEAKIVITTHTFPAANGGAGGTTNTANAVEADLIIDSIVKDTTNIGMLSGANSFTAGNATYARSAYGAIGDGKFNVKGLSLVGDGAKVITIENITDNGTASATFSGYLV